MHLVANWRGVLLYAWSIRLIFLAAVLSGLEVILPLVGPRLPVPPGAFALLTFVTTAGAFFARLTAQKGISDE